MASSNKAVHFGAGNIGRGFVGQFLHASGYEVVFADVDDSLVTALNRAGTYEVHQVASRPGSATSSSESNQGSVSVAVDGFRALNNARELEAVAAEISTAAIVTTSVGPRILPSLAHVIAEGLALRPAELPPLIVIACETAIGASATLGRFVRQERPGVDALFANCAIDRIVPEQSPGLDVTIESFFEWVVESGPFEGRADVPEIDGVTWVSDLAPYIERKLFTVNTAHATAAYLGFAKHLLSIREALADPEIHAEVLGVLAETKALLVAKHGVDPVEHQAYIEKNLERISNPALPDTTGRVGRNPLSKLSRHERLVGPAAQLAERGESSVHLVRAVRAALDFDVPDDVESRELQSLLRSRVGHALLTETLTGVYPEHPLFPALDAAVSDRLRVGGAADPSSHGAPSGHGAPSSHGAPVSA